MAKIQIEGLKVTELLKLPSEYFDELVLIDKPIIIHIGSAEVLGQFTISDDNLIVELAHIEGGGEGVLPTIARVSKHIAKQKNLQKIQCIVHAINCANPNLKLRAHLEKTGFGIKEVPTKGKAYFKEISVL